MNGWNGIIKLLYVGQTNGFGAHGQLNYYSVTICMRLVNLSLPVCRVSISKVLIPCGASCRLLPDNALFFSTVIIGFF